MRQFRLRSPVVKLSENDVEKQALDILIYRQWWVKRNHVGKFILPDRRVVEILHQANANFRWITVGEPGDPDYTVLHRTMPGFLMETKKPRATENLGQRLKAKQIEMGYGIPTILVDGVESLIEWLAAHEANWKKEK